MVELEEAIQEAGEDMLRGVVELGEEDHPQGKTQDGKRTMKVGTDSKVLEPDLGRPHKSKNMKMSIGQSKESIMTIGARIIMGSTIIENMGSTMARSIQTTTIDQIDLTDLIDQIEEKDLGAQVGIDTMQEMRAQDKIEAEEETDRREGIAPGKEARGDSTLVQDEDTAQRPLVMLGLL